MKRCGAQMCTLAWFLLLASAPAFAEYCNANLNVTMGTQRLSGNSMEGYVVAWADDGDWWDWEAQVYGQLLFKPSGGASWSLQDDGFSSWGPLEGGDDDGGDDSYNPTWRSTSYLNSNGAGAYAVYGYGSFSCEGEMYDEYVGAGMSDGESVVRPVISPPALTYGSNCWAFWYLNGQPSIDGYYVQAALSANDNLSGSSYEGGTPSYAWGEVTSGSKVSFSPSDGTQTTVTSEAASDEAIYDVTIGFWVDGFESDPFYLAINTPIAAEALSVITPIDDDYPGYRTYVQYEITDLWTEVIAPITTNETHGNVTYGDPNNGGCPPTSGWPWPPAASVWTVDPFLWNDGQSFIDTIWATDPNNTFIPHPVPADQGTGCLVMSGGQGIFAGSGTNGQGTQVLAATQSWHDNSGSVQ